MDCCLQERACQRQLVHDSCSIKCPEPPHIHTYIHTCCPHLPVYLHVLRHEVVHLVEEHLEMDGGVDPVAGDDSLHQLGQRVLVVLLLRIQHVHQGAAATQEGLGADHPLLIADAVREVHVPAEVPRLELDKVVIGWTVCVRVEEGGERGRRVSSSREESSSSSNEDMRTVQ